MGIQLCSCPAFDKKTNSYIWRRRLPTLSRQEIRPAQRHTSSSGHSTRFPASPSHNSSCALRSRFRARQRPRGCATAPSRRTSAWRRHCPSWCGRQAGWGFRRRWPRKQPRFRRRRRRRPRTPPEVGRRRRSTTSRSASPRLTPPFARCRRRRPKTGAPTELALDAKSNQIKLFYSAPKSWPESWLT